MRWIFSHQICRKTGESSEETGIQSLQPSGNDRIVAASVVESYSVSNVVRWSGCVAKLTFFRLVVRYWLVVARDS